MPTANTAIADSTVRMDSRKFLGALNDSAQAKVAFFEERIQQMGRQAGENYQLTALHAKQLYFESLDSGNYFVAEHSRDKGGKVNISNIRPVEIVEEEKQSLFGESCLRLVSSIEENDTKGMQSAFNRMKAQRFSGRVVPYSGMIKSRDGVVRHINISTGESLGEETRSALIATIVESLRDSVIIENGRVVSGHFNDGAELKLPVTKWAARKLVAKRMRDTAQNAFWSEGFQKRVQHTARLVSESNIEAAVRTISPFLEENEEFTLLTRSQARTLIENALAAGAIFNDTLCRDTATLFHRTNMQISRRKIIDEWRNIAKKAEHPVLAENVQILENANNFEAAFDKFLALIFEAISNKEVAAEALATTLQVLMDKTPKIKESHDLTSKLTNLITRLKQKDFDDAAIYEAEDLIATIQEELAATDTLGSFDQMPGDELGMGMEEEPVAEPDLGGGEGAGAPVININSPLIQIGGTSAAGGGEEELAAAPEEDLGLGGEEDLGLGGGAPGEEAGGAEDELAAILGGGGMESTQNKGKLVSESAPVHFEMQTDGDDDQGGRPASGDDEEHEDDPTESTDPYAIRKGEFDLTETGSVMMDYGAPVITNGSDLKKVVTLMGRLAKEHKLVGTPLEENLVGMAQAGIKAIGLRIPKGRVNKAVEECVALFREEAFPGAAAPFGSKDSDSDSDDDSSSDSGSSGSGKPWESGSDSGSDDSDDGESKSKSKSSNDDDDSGDGGWKKPWENDDEEGTTEDQFKGPRIRGRGFKKTSYEPRELKNESITKKQAFTEGFKWGEAQPDGMLGQFAGVGFIFDHGGNTDMTPVILSEDGSVEIPIPEELFDSAFAAAGLMKGNVSKFANWLWECLEQLRPISTEEDDALSEAMANITTNPDGGISVEVSNDVEVGEMDDMGGPGGEMDTAGMEPVDSMDSGGDEMMGGDDMGMGGDEMPNYEGGDEMGMDGGGMDDQMDGDQMGGAIDDGMNSGGGMDDGMGGGEEDEMDMKRRPLEDKDITQPRSGKYTKHVKDNPRDMPDHKMTKKTDDKLDSIGPDLKVDDGSGTKPPTAKSMSKE